MRQCVTCAHCELVPGVDCDYFRCGKVGKDLQTRYALPDWCPEVWE